MSARIDKLKKEIMYRKLRSGAFGNHMRIFGGLYDILGLQDDTEVSVRPVFKGGKPATHVTFGEARFFAAVHRLFGVDCVVSEASPDDHLIVQGECWWSKDFDYPEDYFWLRYSKVKAAMKESLKSDNNYLEGRTAEVFLRKEIGQQAWSNLVFLNLLYPQQVIEFSAYDIKVGVDQEYMVIWEVRDY